MLFQPKLFWISRSIFPPFQHKIHLKIDFHIRTLSELFLKPYYVIYHFQYTSVEQKRAVDEEYFYCSVKPVLKQWPVLNKEQVSIPIEINGEPWQSNIYKKSLSYFAGGN